ncbi:Sulfate adenylyltransferase, dissimilatory-type [hydrothermal vent metagenome]|uniref:Sulfate adenylyltransferase, dissimilatory-type n=1 Tax=hydrothermal vent metagenome TaxID=652676 RepID=A0A1W1EC50_9ZZZZ
MVSSRKNKSLYIDTEALSTLALVQSGLVAPITKLMNKKTADMVEREKQYKGIDFPFAFVLAPKGKRNIEVLKSLTKGETVDLITDGKKVGELTVEETFPINSKKRLESIYGTADTNHPGVRNTFLRLGELAVCGEYHVEYPLIEENKKKIKDTIEKTGAKHITSMMIAANPLNRAHERMIRQAISESDLLVIFLRKPFNTDGLNYDIRFNALNTFINHYINKSKVIIIPFENTYIFAGVNELILDAVLAKNYGCNRLVIGKNHGGLGLYYDKNRLSSIFDHFKDGNIQIKTVDEYVYCDMCKTLVSSSTCPHGQHHHVHYHSYSIMKLLQSGLIPPSILVRKEVSANILASLFPERFEKLQELHYALVPGSGLIEEKSEEDFYLKLADLYHTPPLT